MAQARSRSKTTREFEKAVKKANSNEYVLKLYITGMTPGSVKAISNLKRICEEHLKGRYELEVVDIYQDPVLARGEQIIATPTLVKKLPLPLRKFLGDMSETKRILLGLDLRLKKERKKTGDET